jgi:hypothetical protein
MKTHRSYHSLSPAWRKDDWADTKSGFEEDWWDHCRSEIQCFHHAAKTIKNRKNCDVISELASRLSNV